MDSVRHFFRTLVGKFTGGYGESDLPKYTFYDTIEEFGYHFNAKEELVDENGGRFKFVVREDDRNYNQQHYDALGELITEYLYTKMETDLQLQKVFIPLDAKKEEPQSFIFQSPDAGHCETLMVIINGGGSVRAGQWSRKLIINEGLESGSQFPYIRRAREAGFGVVVLNTNLNQQMVNDKAADVRGNGSAEDHGQYVWKHIISKMQAVNIVIVAHSYGGMVTCTMAEKFLEDFKKRVFCIVFTDSIHTVERDRWPQPLKEFLKERAVNFASTYVPLDYMMQASASSDCLSVSAGTEEHERTSYACIDSAFSLIHDNLTTWTADGSMAPRHFKPLPDDLSEFSCATRWQRKMEKVEQESESSSSVDAAKSAASPPETEKRSAEDVEEEAAVESVSENGGSNQGEKKADSKKDEDAHSPAKKGGRHPDGEIKGDSEKSEEEAALSEKREEEAALSEKREEEAALSGKREEEAALSGKNEEEAALSEKREEEAALSEKSEEEAALSGKNEEEAALSEKSEEEAALSGKREEKAALSGKNEEEAALSEKNEEEAALSEKSEEEAALSKNGMKQEKEQKPTQEPSCEQETVVAASGKKEARTEDEGKDPGLATVDAETAQVQQVKGSEKREDPDSRQREDTDSRQRENTNSREKEDTDSRVEEEASDRKTGEAGTDGGKGVVGETAEGKEEVTE